MLVYDFIRGHPKTLDEEQYVHKKAVKKLLSSFVCYLTYVENNEVIRAKLTLNPEYIPDENEEHSREGEDADKIQAFNLDTGDWQWVSLSTAKIIEIDYGS